MAEEPKTDTPLTAQAQASGPPKRSITLKKPSILTSGRGGGSVPAALMPAPSGVLARSAPPPPKPLLAPEQAIVVAKPLAPLTPAPAPEPAKPLDPQPAAVEAPIMPEVAVVTPPQPAAVQAPLRPTPVAAEAPKTPQIAEALEPAPQPEPLAAEPVAESVEPAEVKGAPEPKSPPPLPETPAQTNAGQDRMGRQGLVDKNETQLDLKPEMDRKSQNKLVLKNKTSEQPHEELPKTPVQDAQQKETDTTSTSKQNPENNGLTLKLKKPPKPLPSKNEQPLEPKQQPLQNPKEQPRSRINPLFYALPVFLIAISLIGGLFWYAQGQSSGPVARKAQIQTNTAAPDKAQANATDALPSGSPSAEKSKNALAQQWVNNLTIQAILGSAAKSKIMIDGKTYLAGSVVDPTLSITFTGVDASFVYFSDSEKRVYRVRR